MSRVALFLAALLFGVGTVQAEAVQAPRVVQVWVRPDDVRVVETPPVEVVEPVDLVRQSVIDEAEKCAEWAGLAYDIGWPVVEIPRLLDIMHRESRCLPDACSQSDSGRVCRDWGLMQINEYSWKRTITNQGMVMRDMWNPELNLRFALWLWTYSEDRNGDGWQPWAIQHS